MTDINDPGSLAPLLGEIENERNSWFDPAADFLDQVVQSGHRLNNPQA